MPTTQLLRELEAELARLDEDFDPPRAPEPVTYREPAHRASDPPRRPAPSRLEDPRLLAGALSDRAGHGLAVLAVLSVVVLCLALEAPLSALT